MTVATTAAKRPERFIRSPYSLDPDRLADASPALIYPSRYPVIKPSPDRDCPSRCYGVGPPRHLYTPSAAQNPIDRSDPMAEQFPHPTLWPPSTTIAHC